MPAVYSRAVPLTIRRWDVPGEPVPMAEALLAPYTTTEAGDRWGPVWGTTWFELTGTVPADWAGKLVEGAFDLGFTGIAPGFTAEGLVYRADGTPIKGLHPYNRWFPVDPDATNVTALVEADLCARGGTDRPRRPQRPSAGGRLRGARSACGAASSRRSTGRPAMGRYLGCSGHPHPERHQRHSGGIPRSAGPAAGQTGQRQRAPDQRGRPRPHRFGLAVALARDRTEGRPDLYQRHPIDGRLSRVDLCDVAGATVRLDRRAAPDGLRARAGKDRVRPVRAGWRHVGGGGHQYARWGGDGPAVRPWEALLRREVWHGYCGGLAARLIRFLRGTAPADRPVGLAVLPDAEDFLEQDQPLPAPHVLVGRARRHPCLHPLPPGRDLQL